MVYFNYSCIIRIIRAVNQYVNELNPIQVSYKNILPDILTL